MSNDKTATAARERRLGARTLPRSRGQSLVADTLAGHADELLRTARRVSICAEDAEDAYQRGLEIFVRNVDRLTADDAVPWLHTVIRHEALRVRKGRTRLTGPAMEPLADDAVAADVRSPEERAIGADRFARATEALRRLKRDELRALWLQALGLSYAEIGEQTGWTLTKVNRALTEGRRAFLERYAGIQSGAECYRWAPIVSALVDGEATTEQLVELRPHLRNCPACRAMMRELYEAGGTLRCVLPAGLAGVLGQIGPGLAAAGGAGAIGIAGVAGGGAAATGGAVLAGTGSGALLSGTLAKVAATVVLAAGAGAGVAIERGANGTHAPARPSAVAAAARTTRGALAGSQASLQAAHDAALRRASQRAAARRAVDARNTARRSAARRRPRATAAVVTAASRVASTPRAATSRAARSGEFAPAGGPVTTSGSGGGGGVEFAP